MQNLFVYGTLEFAPVVKKLLGSVPRGESALLPEHSRHMLMNRNYPGIIRQPGAQVDGILYRGITAKYLRILDRYEDDIYQRQLVSVIDSCGRQVNAWAYIIPLRYKKELMSLPWDRNKFAPLP